MQIERAATANTPEADVGTRQNAHVTPLSTANDPAQEAIVAQVTEHVETRFAALAEDEPRFHATLQAAFGQSYHASIAEGLRTQALIGDFSFLPAIEFVPTDSMQHHLGAYHVAEGKVFLNAEASADQLAPVYLEEVGHHLDTLMSRTDAKGDEGALFRMLLSGESAQSEQFGLESVQNDHGVLNVHGQPASVEFYNYHDHIQATQTFQIEQQLNTISFTQNQFFTTHQSNNDAIQAALNANLHRHQNYGSGYTSSVSTPRVTISPTATAPPASSPTTVSANANPGSVNLDSATPDSAHQNLGRVSGFINAQGQLAVNWDTHSESLPSGARWLTQDELITASYHHFLGRAPDAGGYADYQEALNDPEHPMTPHAMVESIQHSEEALGLRNNHIDPDLKFTISELPEHTLATSQDAALLQDSRLSDQAFVAKAFDSVLQRPASAADANWYTLQLTLGNQSRSDLLKTLASSDEQAQLATRTKIADVLGVDGQKIQLTQTADGAFVAQVSQLAQDADQSTLRTQVSVLWRNENDFSVQVSQEYVIGDGKPRPEEETVYEVDQLTVTPEGEEGNTKLREFATAFVPAVADGFNDAREELASDVADFVLDYQRGGFYATEPGKAATELGEFISAELYEAIHGDPARTETAQFLTATGDFIRDWWTHKEETLHSAADFWQTAGTRLGEFIDQTDGKTLGEMTGKAIGEGLFQTTTGTVATKGAMMAAESLGDLAQAAVWVGKGNKEEEAKGALAQLEIEGKINTSPPTDNALAGEAIGRGDVAQNETRWFDSYLSNSSAPGIRARLIGATQEIREDLPRTEIGNVGFAEVKVPAIADDLVILKAFSGYDHRVDDFLPIPDGDLDTWVLTPRVATSRYLDTPQGYLRSSDTEFKILETLSQRLGDNRSATGTINLMSERHVCPSCADVVGQFRERYPNIQLNVFTGKD